MLSVVVWVSIFLMSVTLHEIAHGLVANALGDSTAKRAGRLTLNPLKHIDPFWTVILPGILFISTGGRFAIGMAKPVPVNFARLRHPKRDMIWVALAGPFANVILAFLSNIMFKLTAQPVFLYAIYFNLGLAMFNLFPIPPLDGSRILGGLLPNSWMLQLFKYERYGFLVVMALYFSGILLRMIFPAINFFCRLMDIPMLGFRA